MEEKNVDGKRLARISKEHTTKRKIWKLTKSSSWKKRRMLSKIRWVIFKMQKRYSRIKEELGTTRKQRQIKKKYY